jgi:hypothetical protein
VVVAFCSILEDRPSWEQDNNITEIWKSAFHTKRVNKRTSKKQSNESLHNQRYRYLKVVNVITHQCIIRAKKENSYWYIYCRKKSVCFWLFIYLTKMLHSSLVLNRPCVVIELPIVKCINKDLLQITGFLFMKCFGIHFTIGSSITTHGLFKTKEECNILVKYMKSQNIS